MKSTKTFTIWFEETKIIIESQDTKLDSIDKLLFTLFVHYRQKKPDRLDELMGQLNFAYETAKEKIMT